jgi:predicted ATPase
MIINKLGLKNFKCFKEVEVDFSKITLLTGENSSGKSSLIYGLLAPFQSEGFPLYLFPNGKYVNMGDFEEISFKNLKNNKIEINFDVEGNMLPYKFKMETTWVLNLINKLPKLYCFKINRIDNNPPSQYPKSILEVSFDNDFYQCNLYEKNNIQIVKNLKIYDLDAIYNTGYLDTGTTKDISEISNTLRTFHRWLKNQESYELFNSIGSYRLYPERTYYQKTISNRRILSSGEGYVDQILEWQEKGEGKYVEFNEFISILKDLKLLYDIKTHKLGGGRFDLKVKVKKSSNWASLADVGFGVSQLLPIIVADLQLPNGYPLIISQPETHLHPSIQAEFGTYLVKQVNQLEKQYIVETHSEYLINRLRLSIVKGEIEPEDVAVYYFENTAQEGSIAHRIEFTKHGQILNAPQGFFDTYMMDTMNIALNA